MVTCRSALGGRSRAVSLKTRSWTRLSVFALAREGRTHLLYDVSLVPVEGSKCTARAMITFYNPSAVDAVEQRMPLPWGGRASPDTMTNVPDMPSPSGGEWMMAATDIRTQLTGVYWFQWRIPLLDDGWHHWFTRILAPSDWVPGFVSPGFATPQQIGPWPNTDLTLTVDRPLSGSWIGIEPKGHYRREGLGFAYSDILDQDGIVGHVVGSVIAPAGGL